MLPPKIQQINFCFVITTFGRVYDNARLQGNLFVGASHRYC
jgi:hypothetical protein